MGKIRETRHKGVYNIKGKLGTLSIVPEFKIHGELVVRDGQKEYRIWDPKRSKLAAAIMKGLKEWPFIEGVSVLYLGAAAGVTPSFISDVVGAKGKVFAVEFSPECVREMLLRCGKRENVWPVLEDARFPERYSFVGEVDVLFEDVAQPDQDRILIENSRYLKRGGIAMIAVKSQSIDVRLKPKEVYDRVIARLEKDFDVIEKMQLDPYEKHHMFIVLRKK